MAQGLGSSCSIGVSGTMARRIPLDAALTKFNAVQKRLEGVADLVGFEQAFGQCPTGLQAMFTVYQDSSRNFFTHLLPFIVDCASRLPAEELKVLVQGRTDRLFLSREMVLSLLAHMFLCTLTVVDDNMPHVGFDCLLFPRRPARQEVAKLRMFVHYFERCRQEMPKGELRIYRQAREGRQNWKDSTRPLLAMDCAPPMTGFEDPSGNGCLHADFANKFLGGGVLVGGCVQEEIRFSICPELCAAMVVCPYMLDNEAITIVGGEQFCSYKGYGRSLEFDANYRDPSPKDADGTVLVAITAMDALDFRHQDSSVSRQLQEPLLLRELEKAAAAFAPVDEAALAQWPVIATGNWGCGAFEGCLQLKALLQWIAASEGRRKLLYFPFDENIGPDLSRLSQDLCAAGITAGQLFAALTTPPLPRSPGEIFEHVRDNLAVRSPPDPRE
mmetsp:Transcript_98611/g.234899  ORF Transcript_98611/g.234899 Transcript_98611/m.234899 type:complete len:443 (+) Transcript_98611:1-1329(+)